MIDRLRPRARRLCAAFAELATSGGLFWPIAEKSFTLARSSHIRELDMGEHLSATVAATVADDETGVSLLHSPRWMEATFCHGVLSHSEPQSGLCSGVVRATSCTFSRTVSTISHSAFCSPACFSLRQKPSRDAIHKRGGGGVAQTALSSP